MPYNNRFRLAYDEGDRQCISGDVEPRIIAAIVVVWYRADVSDRFAMRCFWDPGGLYIGISL